MNSGRMMLWIVLALATAGPAAAQREKPFWEIYPERGWPAGTRIDVEKLLHEADLVQPPLSPLKFARLATTPELLARMVLDRTVAEYVTRHGRLIENRLWRARLYGFYLALQVGVEPKAEIRDWMLERIGAANDSDPTWYLLELFRLAAGKPGRRLWLRDLNPRARLAVELLRQRVPLDADILQQIVKRAGQGLVEAGQRKRLAQLWRGLDASGKKHLSARAGKLPPLLQRAK